MYKVTQLHSGPRFEIVRTGFARSSAAKAWLIDYANGRGAKAIYAEDDAENPGCVDIMVDFGGRAEQFAIERDE